MIIYNNDTKPFHVKQYAKVMERMRPGHADYTFHIKYGVLGTGGGRPVERPGNGLPGCCGGTGQEDSGREGIEIRGYTKRWPVLPSVRV